VNFAPGYPRRYPAYTHLDREIAIALKPNQFTLSSMALLVLLAALAVAFRNQLVAVAFQGIATSSCAIFFVSFTMARHWQLRSSMILLMRVSFLTATLFANFTVLRLRVGMYGSGSFPREFPFPDKLITGLEFYFRTPADEIPTNSINFHGGELETVAILTWVAMMTAMLAGLSFGASENLNGGITNG